MTRLEVTMGRLLLDSILDIRLCGADDRVDRVVLLGLERFEFRHGNCDGVWRSAWAAGVVGSRRIGVGLYTRHMHSLHAIAVIPSESPKLAISRRYSTIPEDRTYRQDPGGIPFLAQIALLVECVISSSYLPLRAVPPIPSNRSQLIHFR